MLTIGDKVSNFVVVGIAPGKLDDRNAFDLITEKSFPGQWKIVVFYPKDFTLVCPTEIVGYDNLVDEFDKRNAVLLVGSTDNEYCKIAWRNAHEDLKKTRHWSFADQKRRSYSDTEDALTGLADRLGVINKYGIANRATFIIDPDNVIQHVTVNNLNVGRSPEETLRVLDAIQTNKPCACNRKLNEETLEFEPV